MFVVQDKALTMRAPRRVENYKRILPFPIEQSLNITSIHTGHLQEFLHGGHQSAFCHFELFLLLTILPNGVLELYFVASNAACGGFCFLGCTPVGKSRVG